MFEKKYIIESNAPAAVTQEDYSRNAYKEYIYLLDNYSDDEDKFQQFFEQNPAFMPGAFQLFGESGHYPYPIALISQPELDGGIFRRVPDFIWLAQNSLNFTPVIIEIEKPSKKTFTQEGIQTADLTQAINQIVEWKTILSQPENILMFYKTFNIPERIRQKRFKPQFGLIYGRRSEYEKEETLTRKRAELVPDDVLLMSYDRINPLISKKNDDLICCKLKHGKYYAISIPPTFKYSPGIATSYLSDINDFESAIDLMKMVSDDRKKFLNCRYKYWMEYSRLQDHGIISSGDCE